MRFVGFLARDDHVFLVQRLLESGRAVNESPGTEVQIPGYGDNDNTEAGRS